ncbi:hypothetical protein APHAL10511_007680 [Amanita phalloides]|nr:hypothetical protein APHAL10511_007680 [Amanita phalloides]
MQDTAESSSTSGMPHRTAWKTNPRTKEVVWPHHLEACLIDGLRNFADRQKRIKRCRFISSYMKEKTGIYRSPQQIGSRLQMILKNGKNPSLTDLILSTQRKSPTQPLHTHVFRLDSTPGSPQRRHEPSYEDNIQTPSPLSTNARLSVSPYFEPPNVQLPWNQGDLPLDNRPLNVDHPPFYAVESGAIESVYNPDTSTVAYNNDTFLRGQPNNTGYLQPTFTEYPSQQFSEDGMYPSMDGMPNFQPDVDFWEWYSSTSNRNAAC